MTRTADPPGAGMQSLLARGVAPVGEASFLTPYEAEHMVQALKKFAIDDIGSRAWLDQQEAVDKLNLQGHYNANTQSEEFVKDYLVSHDKINVIIHELLVMEGWRLHVLPLIADFLAAGMPSVAAYIVIAHEANLANLTELVLFHEDAVGCIEECHLLELIDWCYRQLQYLNTAAHKDLQYKQLSPKELLEQAPTEEFECKVAEVRSAVGMCTLTILRYLTERPGQLAISGVARLVSTHDMVLALVPLADAPPWERERQGRLERLEGTQWTAVPAAERFKLSTANAQVWLALNNLLVDPHFRSKYHVGDFHVNALLRLKRFMNDLLLDQLPVLKDLQRALDEVAMSIKPHVEGHAEASLVIEQMPGVRDSILNGRDWPSIAAAAKATLQSSLCSGERLQARMAAMVKAFDFMLDNSLADSSGCGGAAGGGDEGPEAAAIKVSVYAAAGTGTGAGRARAQSWDEMSLWVDKDAPSEEVTLKGDGGTVVRGRRWRLCSPPKGSTKPLPSKGRLVVCHEGKTADALLELPAAETKTDEGLRGVPLGLWLTVGLLATDGFALQLKLMRTAAAGAVRNTADGTWNVYAVVGGAVTFRTAVEKRGKVAPAMIEEL